MVPVDQWLESILKPVVGIGLLFLIGRNLLDQARDGNPVVFAGTVLLLLYGAAIVGIAYRWGYSVLRGSRVKDEFEAQIVDNLMPLSYDLTRTRGRIEFIAQMSMDERITVMNEAPTKQLTFADLQSLPPSKNRGIIPKNPLK